MNNTIYKYTLAVEDQQEILLPAGAQVLSAATQAEQICIWAMVDSSLKPTERKQFRMYGTGHPIKPDALGVQRFVGTCLLQNGALVFHVFEYTPNKESLLFM